MHTKTYYSPKKRRNSIKDAIVPLDSEDRANVLIVDDSMFERNRSKKAELLTKVYDHAKHAYKFGFRLLTLGWSDGSTFLPVSSVLLSSENKKNRINEASVMDKRTVGYKRRQLSMQKGTSVMLDQLHGSLYKSRHYCYRIGSLSYTSTSFLRL